MDIRACRAPDVPLLETWRPTGPTRAHAARFHRQQSGGSTFLVAWTEDGPAGSCEVRWTGCEAVEVRRRFPDCPEINGLQVWPAERQSRGIGTALIAEAEARARRHGRALIGLGVGDDNPRARSLYLRLGYTDQDCPYIDRYSWLDGAGTRHHEADPCRFLVKHLDGNAPLGSGAPGADRPRRQPRRVHRPFAGREGPAS